MGSIKKALKPVTRVIDDIIPNEIKPALPYIAATFGAPYLAGSSLFGGIGNLGGAVLGGLLLGLIESIGAGYIGQLTGGFLGSHYQDVFAFVVLIVVLVFRPTGIMGERVAERA